MPTKAKPRSKTPAAQVQQNLNHIHAEGLDADLGVEQHDRESVHGAHAPPRLLSKLEVLDKTSLSFPYIWKLMQRGDFPRSRAVGGKVVWIESEIDSWIDNLPVKKLKADAS